MFTHTARHCLPTACPLLTATPSTACPLACIPASTSHHPAPSPVQVHVHPLYVNEAAEAAGGNGGVAGATAEVLLERALFGGEGGLAGVLGGAHAAKEAAVRGARDVLGLAARLFEGNRALAAVPAMRVPSVFPSATCKPLPTPAQHPVPACHCPSQVLFSGLGGELAASMTRRLTQQGVVSECILVCDL